MNFLTRYYGFLTGFLLFIIYLTTAAPAVTEFDSGELAAVQATLGIAHPPGYPLFTILGYLFLKIPLPVSNIFQLHLLAALWTSLTAAVFIYTAKLILDNSSKFLSAKENDFSLSEIQKYVISISAGLIFGLSRILWSQSLTVEVYSLQFFIASLIIFFSLKAYVDEEGKFSKYWYYTAVFLGLGSSNHMMTLYLLPALLFLFFSKEKLKLISVKRLILPGLIIFSIALLFYLFIPLRASQGPLLNWGEPSEFKSLYEHISAKYYSQYFFGGWEVVKKQLTFFISSIGLLPHKEFFWENEFNINTIFCLSGLVISFFYFRKLFLFFILILTTTLFFSSQYLIPDIYTYFSFAYLSLAFFALFGISGLIYFLNSKRINYLVPASVLFLFILLQASFNYKIENKSDYFLIEDYTKALLKYTPENGVIFTDQWDYFVAPSYFVQNVEGYRKDVRVIHKDLLVENWYCKNEKESGEILFNAEKQSLDISNLLNRNNFFIPPEILKDEIYSGRFKLEPGQYIIPDVLLFRIVNTTEYIPAADPDFVIRFPKKENFGSKKIRDNIIVMLDNRIRYELQFGRKDRAQVYLSKIIEEFPEVKISEELLAAVKY